MLIKLELTDTGRIYAGNILKNGKMGANFSNVTDQAVQLVFQHILLTKMSGDNKETLEFQEPFSKHGKKYKIEITLTPIE